jgi:orotidine-5'-phosphate decarboxylase
MHDATSRSSFADRLTDAVREKRNPVVVGLDPRWEQLPPPLTVGIAPGDRAALAKVYFRFCADVIDVVANLVPAVKPQAAFFEQLGPDGMVALAEVIRHARKQGLLVILDGKRNDIGSTATAYAEGYLGEESAWRADALTVSPYLGADSIQPFVEVAGERGAGLFVLVKTSNLGGGQFQDLDTDGQPLYRRVALFVEKLAMETAAGEPYGAVGAVVGATYPDQLDELRSVVPHAWFLVPGYGSQGATARDVAGAFDSEGLGAVVNNSRGILFAYRRRGFDERFGAARWQEAVAAATHEMIDELRAATNAGRL